MWLFRIEPICKLILNYLEKKQKYFIFNCLSELNKELNLILKKYWKSYIIIPYGKELVKKKLLQLGFHDPEEFIFRLNENRGIIAGSFPLQCLLDENYLDEDNEKKSDIDIYYLDSNLRYPSLGSYIYFTQNLRWDNYKSYRSDETIKNNEKIINIKDYSTSKVTVQLINVTNPKEFIQNQFDLSFCKTIFDGEYLRIFDPITLQKRGYICSNKIKQLTDPNFEWCWSYSK